MITAATTDQSLVQEGLSERLANRGILPMFGFPTRVRLLYHKAPRGFPLRHVIDANTPISLGSPLWAGVADLAAVTLQAARPGYNRILVGGLPAVTDGTEVVIVTHPLWRIDRASLGPELAAAWDDAERVHGFRVDEQSFISVFEALRRPA